MNKMPWLNNEITEKELKWFVSENILRDVHNTSRDERAIKILNILKHEDLKRPVVYVGMGTCGLGAGADKIWNSLEEYLKENNLSFDILSTGCIGICALEPIMDVVIPGRYRLSFASVTPEQVKPILDDILKGNLPTTGQILGQIPLSGSSPWDGVPMISEHPFFRKQKRIVLSNCGIVNPLDIYEYIARGGFKSFVKVITHFTPEQVCDEIEKSGLRGRGGGGFPTGKKWRFAFEAQGSQKYIVCNADEGDPGAFMDRSVIEGDPYRLIEGMLIGAYAIGATKGYVYIRTEYPLAIKRLEHALNEARSLNLLGENILGTGLNIDIVIKKGAGAFVCGEETALLHSIEGKRGMPRPRPPYPVHSGLFGCPTVINNVETFANVPTIIEKGYQWFASMGTEKSKGTKVFALSGKINYTGLVEIPMGTTIREIVFDIAGGIKDGKKFKAVQIGGPSGGCIPEKYLDTPVDYESLIELGAMMGSGGFVVMDEETCMVDLAKFFMDFIKRESCGKCIPCREGTYRLWDILDRITTKPAQNNMDALERFKAVTQMERLSKVIKETSLCGLGQTAPNPVLSTLRWFKDEYEAHVYDRTCPAGVCKNLKTYTINVDKCTGCTLCSKKCPVNAIVGSKKTPHFIVQDKCIGCGTCYDVCQFKAIEVQ